MKKIAVMMAFLMIVSCLLLAACSDTENESSVAQDSVSSSGQASSQADSQEDSQGESSDSSAEDVRPVSKYHDENGLYTLKNLDMPEFSFGKKTFTVCVYNDKIQKAFYSDEIQPDLYSGGNTLINEVVRGRNGVIKELLGVEIKAYAVDDVSSTLSKSILSDTVSFDAVMPFATQAFSMAENQMLMELNGFSDYLHFDAPWWDQNALEAFSVGGKQYFAVGDLSLGQKRSTRVLLYNRTMYETLCQKKFGDLYTVVSSGEWTLDLMIEMGKKVTKDMDEDGFMTPSDRWGMVGTDSVDPFFEAAGYQWLNKDSAGYLTVSEDLTAHYAYGDLVAQSFLYGDWYLNTQKYRGQLNGTVWDAAIDVFGNGNALFYSSMSQEIDKVQKYGVEYGILPYPKESAAQAAYYAPCSMDTVSVIAIPMGVSDPFFSAYMLEVLACESGNYLQPVYYATLMDPAVSTEVQAVELTVNAFANINYDLVNVGQINQGYVIRSVMNESFLDNTEKNWSAVQEALQQKIREFNDSFS